MKDRTEETSDGGGKESSMERQDLETLGFWERQVACSKLWQELATPVFGIKDNKGRTPRDAKVRRTEWPGWWLYSDGEDFQVLEDSDVGQWVLTEHR